jgi:hypothetical protein
MTDTVKTDGIYNLIEPVVMSFPQLFEAKAFTENGKAKGEPKFSGNFNFNAASEDLKALKALAAKLARAKWPDKPFFLTTQEGEKIPQVLFPFANGDKLADERKKKKGKDDSEYMRGKVIIAARSKYEPRLSYIENNKIIDCEGEMAKQAAKGKFYPGVEVLAQFNLVPYDAVGVHGKPGVTAYLNMVLSTGKGARISGGQTSSEAFKGYVGAVSAEDPTAPGATADMSDEIPY